MRRSQPHLIGLFGIFAASILLLAATQINQARAAFRDCGKNKEGTPIPCTDTPKPTTKPRRTETHTPKPTVLGQSATPMPSSTVTPTWTPTRTLTPTRTRTSSPTPTTGDIWVLGFEITQNIQVYPFNTVPLAAYKPTVVRVYVQSIEDTLGPWNNVTARLTVTGGGITGRVLLPSTSNSSASITVSPSGSNRRTLIDSFNFNLDLDLTQAGMRNLEVNIYPISPRPEATLTNNRMSTTATFRYVPARFTYAVAHGNCVAPAGFTQAGGSGTPVTSAVIDAARPFSDFEPQRRYVENMMPATNFFVSPLPGNPTPCFASTPGWRSDQAANWWAAAQIDRVCPRGGCFLFVYSPRVPLGTGQLGWCCGVSTLGSKIYDGTYPLDSGSEGDTMAQEFFHSFLGNLHTFNPGFGSPWTVPNYPWLPSNNIGGSQVGLRTSAGTFGWGLEIRLSSEGDVMSYNSPPIWISPFTYCGLWFTMNSVRCPLSAILSDLDTQPGEAAAKAELALAPIRKDGQFVQVAGGVMNDGKVILQPLRFVTRDTDITSIPEPGLYNLAFLDSAGTTLASYRFEVKPGTHHIEGETLSFALTVPYLETTAKLAVSYDGKVQAELSRSANPPVVNLLTPNKSQEWKGMQTITWEGNDADGDSLLYDVDYSADGGAIWVPLGSYIMENSLSVDFDQVPGGENGLIRAVASDGWNTGEDVSDVSISVPQHSPEIELIGPPDGSTFYETQPFYISATAFDWEDGPIADFEKFTWSSDIDGEIVHGPWTAVSGLTPGEHTFTIAVVDSDDNFSEKSVHVTILAAEGEGATTSPTPEVSPPTIRPSFWLVLAIAGVGVILLGLLVLAIRRKPTK